MRYKNTDKDIKEIGRELNVTTILGGSVRKEKDDIRVTAELINVKDGFQLWSDIYNQKFDRVFVIQTDVAENIVKALKMELSPEEKVILQKKPTENLEAYNLYIQGRFFLNKRTEEGLNKGLEYFEQAIEQDPDYALGYAGLADSYNLLVAYGITQPKEAYPKAKKAALKALEIDDTLAEAHTSLASIKMSYDWDWEGAEREFKKAIKLKPGYATSHHWHAIYLMHMSRFDEAIEEIQLARELDPFSLVINRNVGAVLYYARKYDRAYEALQKTIEMNPSFSEAHSYLGLVYLQKSEYEDALKELHKEVELAEGHHPVVESWIGIVYARMGEKKKARKVADDLLKRSKQTYISPSWGLLYFALGDIDEGISWVERAIEVYDHWLTWLILDPVCDSVRSDPRFKACMKKIGLEK